MNATKKTTKATRKATTRKATTRRATTRRTATSRSTARRTTRRTTTRRTKPKVATTIGAGLATLAVAAFAGASWPVRIALVVAALVLVGGYLLMQGRRHDADDAAEAAAPSAATPAAPSALTGAALPVEGTTPHTEPAPPVAPSPSADSTPLAEPRPEDPA